MRTGKVLLLAAAAALTCLNVKATITNAIAWGDYDNVNCTYYEWLPLSDELNMSADQYAAGKTWGKIDTDTPEDPSLTIGNTINNDTLFAWTSYKVDVLMNQSFSILSPTVLGPIYSVGDWGVQSYTPSATFNGSQWVAHIVLGGPTAINPGGVLSFSYTLNFTGSVVFTQVLTPVPEPNVLGLLAGGALVFGSARLLRRRPETA